jgi:divalent metal cation (Fe/Co/Zn/Cd) transporter
MPTADKDALFRTASALALLTIFYNIAEGLVSVWFGLADETIALFGFGLDSFVEVISGIGVWHMVRRQRATAASEHDAFERRALRITGSSFYLLAAGLAATAILDLLQQHRPATTFWGIIVAGVSIISMWLLIHYKVKVGSQLNSQAILADAGCTRVCLYLSVILLAASVAFALTGIGWFDALGAGGIAWFSFREGREAFQKANGIACCCAGNCGGSP